MFNLSRVPEQVFNGHRGERLKCFRFYIFQPPPREHLPQKRDGKVYQFKPHNILAVFSSSFSLSICMFSQNGNAVWPNLFIHVHALKCHNKFIYFFPVQETRGLEHIRKTTAKTFENKTVFFLPLSTSLFWAILTFHFFCCCCFRDTENESIDLHSRTIEFCFQRGRILGVCILVRSHFIVSNSLPFVCLCLLVETRFSMSGPDFRTRFSPDSWLFWSVNQIIAR